VTVIDKDKEEKFGVDDSENTWTSGKMEKEEPNPMDELDVVNYNKFFDGLPRLAPSHNDLLLHGSD